MQYVEIQRFGTRLESEAIGHALDQYGIPFVVRGEDAGSMLPSLAESFALCVPEDRVEEVKQLLNCVVSGPEADANDE